MFFSPDTHKAFFFIPHPLPPRNADRELEVEDSSCTHEANKQEDRAGTLFTGNITKQLHQSQASRLRLACCIRNKLLWLGIEYLWHAAKCSLNWDIPLLKWAWVGLCFFQLADCAPPCALESLFEQEGLSSKCSHSYQPVCAGLC